MIRSANRAFESQLAGKAGDEAAESEPSSKARMGANQAQPSIASESTWKETQNRVISGWATNRPELTPSHFRKSVPPLPLSICELDASYASTHGFGVIGAAVTPLKRCE